MNRLEACHCPPMSGAPTRHAADCPVHGSLSGAGSWIPGRVYPRDLGASELPGAVAPHEFVRPPAGWAVTPLGEACAASGCRMPVGHPVHEAPSWSEDVCRVCGHALPHGDGGCAVTPASVRAAAAGWQDAVAKRKAHASGTPDQGLLWLVSHAEEMAQAVWLASQSARQVKEAEDGTAAAWGRFEELIAAIEHLCETAAVATYADTTREAVEVRDLRELVEMTTRDEPLPGHEEREETRSEIRAKLALLEGPMRDLIELLRDET